MINFRYHVVSIIGIFVALAVGVVLGAGPLQTRIRAGVSSSGATTTVDPAASAHAEAEAAGLKALASSTLAGSLAGRQVALVVLPGASEDDVSAIRSTLTDAGASVVGRVSLTDNWESTSMSQYRTTLASHLSSGGAKTASADGIVGYAIAQVLSSTGAETDLLRQILTDQSTPIMTVDEDPAGGASTLVAIGARAQAQPQATASPSAVSKSSDAWAGLAQAVGSTSGVVVGDASSRDAMITYLRGSATGVTTVDSVGTTLAAVDTALALAHGGSGARAFGVGNGAQSVVPSTK